MWVFIFSIHISSACFVFLQHPHNKPVLYTTAILNRYNLQSEVYTLLRLYMVLRAVRTFLLLYWLLTMARESIMSCYLTPTWGGGRWICTIPKGIYVKLNLMILTRIWTWHANFSFWALKHYPTCTSCLFLFQKL